MKIIHSVFIYFLATFILQNINAQPRTIESFNASWKFHLGEVPDAKNENFNDESWRSLNLPHDWSIEGKFDKDNPAEQVVALYPAG